MLDTDRYVHIGCACGAEWIEDRMEPGPVCPSCTHYEPWPLVEHCSRLGVDGPGQFDVAATKLAQFLGSCEFRTSPQAETSRGKTKTGCWTYIHKDGKTSWTISVEVSRYTDTDAVRSVALTYLIDRKPALEIMFLSGQQLLDMLANIVRTIGRYSSVPIPAAKVLFCGASTV